MTSANEMDRWILPKPRLDELIKLLATDGYEVVGPRLDQGAIVYAAIQSVRDLPIGWTARQAPGSYRLEKRDDEAYFGYAVGPHSWKKYLFPPVLRLWHAQRTAQGFEVCEEEMKPQKRAFLGMRACELHALAVQDRVFLDREGCYTDPHYAHAREQLFLMAVECEHPADTCFCTSMGTGPEVDPERIPLLASKFDDGARQVGNETRAGARIPLPVTAPTTAVEKATLPVCDLVLTELTDAFVVRAASPAGRSVVEQLNLVVASRDHVQDGKQRTRAAVDKMKRSVDVTDVRGLLHRNQEHPRWDNVAGRCLACTNCTLVCPTCFCSCTEDVTDLTLESAERVRRWDSCFNPEFGRVHGGNFRPSVRARYRQWLTHKFASWFDQFDMSGCVGCGRCITWCPVGIDVTEEITAIRAGDGQLAEKTS